MLKAKRLQLVIVVIAISAIAAAAIVLYNFVYMPAWIRVERLSQDIVESSGQWVRLSDKQLANEMPMPLNEAVMDADSNYPLDHTPSVKASYFEGRKILDVFQSKILEQPLDSGNQQIRLIVYQDGDEGTQKLYDFEIIFG